MGYGSSMELRLGLVVLGIACNACSTPSWPPDLPPPAPSLRLVAGEIGGSGNVDGPGPQARFSGPTGMTSDGAGNLYVADTANRAIRKIVTATGEVSTLPLTPVGLTVSGSAPALLAPEGIAADGGGNLYVADPVTHTLYKVALATGALRVLAGSGRPRSIDGTGEHAGFVQPRGLALDGAGNLYVADGGGNAIRKVALATGEVTTLAGSPQWADSQDGIGTKARFRDPHGLALVAGSLYVADTGNHTIRKVVLETAEVTTLAGTARNAGRADGSGPDAQFLEPEGLSADGAGSLYVADASNHAIRRIELATRRVTTLAGKAAGTQADDTSGSTDGVGAAARFHLPSAAVSDGAGFIYVTDTRNHTVRKVTAATGEVTTFAGSALTTSITDGVGAAARFGELTGVAMAGDGSAYVLDNHTVRRVRLATGEVTTLAGRVGEAACVNGIGTGARFNAPTGLTWDGADALYVADRGNYVIRKMTISTGQVATVVGTAGQQGLVDGAGLDARFNLPQGVALDGAGNLYVVDFNGVVRKVVLATGQVTTLRRAAGEILQNGLSSGVVADGAGNLYIAEFGDAVVRKVEVATGLVTTVAGADGMPGATDGIGPAARLTTPWALALDGAGGLYVTDLSKPTLRRIALSSGEVTTVAGRPDGQGIKLGPLPAGLTEPRGVAVTPTGELIVVTTKAVLAVR